MFNPTKTLKTVTGGFLNPRTTWQHYLAQAHDWKRTALELTFPLIIISALVSWLLFKIMGSYIPGIDTSITALLLQILLAFIGIVITAFVFAFIAGFLGGENNFAKAFAAISLSMIPGYIGGMLAPIPLLSALIALGLGILSLVYLYKILPLYLNIPRNKRVLHFILSLIATLIVMMPLSMLFVPSEEDMRTESPKLQQQIEQHAY